MNGLEIGDDRQEGFLTASSHHTDRSKRQVANMRSDDKWIACLTLKLRVVSDHESVAVAFLFMSLGICFILPFAVKREY